LSHVTSRPLYNTRSLVSKECQMFYTLFLWVTHNSINGKPGQYFPIPDQPVRKSFPDRLVRNAFPDQWLNLYSTMPSTSSTANKIIHFLLQQTIQWTFYVIYFAPFSLANHVAIACCSFRSFWVVLIICIL